MSPTTDSPPPSPNRRVVLLAGQAFALGLMAVWVAIPASAIFLESYGAGLLPVTYLGAALAGGIASASLTVALRRHALVTVAAKSLAALAILLLASWLLLWSFNAVWLSFGLLVLVPIVAPLGFMVVVAQAGMLLDVRTLKSHYARVIAGFALGFVAGGLSAPALMSVLGRTQHLLAGATVAAVMFTLLVVATRRRFPTELLVVGDGSAATPAAPTLRSLLHHRYVTLIIGFQMLSAVESQWLDFLVLDRAAQRYPDGEDLAAFIGRFMAVTYGVNILFLLLVAGALIRRFGLRYGLTANPGAVLALVVAVISVSSLQGSGATAVFALIVAARVSDLVLSDGAARASLSAAYQVVPTHLRLATQAAVEGLAVPVAIGISGLALLALRATIGTDGLALPIMTSIVVIAWAVVALMLYRGYRVNLLTSLRHRSLDPAALVIDSESTLAAIHRLVDSHDERDVRLGLDTLEIAEHPDLARCVRSLSFDDRVGVRLDALDRLVRLDPVQAGAVARHGVDHADANVRAASVRTLGRVGESSDVPAIVGCLSDADAEVQVAATTALIGRGDDVARRHVAMQLGSLCRSGSSAELVLAARVLGGCGPDSGVDRGPLRMMLTATDHVVANAALAAIRWPDDEALLFEVVGHLDHRRTAAAAVDALTRRGEPALEVADAGLAGRFGLGSYGHEQLVRVCREIGGSGARAVLRRHLDHRDRDVGLVMLVALASIDARRSASRGDPITADEAAMANIEVEVLRRDLEHAVAVLQAWVVIEGCRPAGPLRSALADELALLRRRVLACLALRYGAESLSTVEFQLAQRDSRTHALALEWLDVTLVGADSAAVPLLEPELAPSDRLRRLTRWFPASPLTMEAALIDLVEDREDRWRRPWIRACAFAAGAGMPEFISWAPASTELHANAFNDDVDGPAQIMWETVAAVRQRQALHRVHPRSRVPAPPTGSGGAMRV